MINRDPFFFLRKQMSKYNVVRDRLQISLLISTEFKKIN